MISITLVTIFFTLSNFKVGWVYTATEYQFTGNIPARLLVHRTKD